MTLSKKSLLQLKRKTTLENIFEHAVKIAVEQLKLSLSAVKSGVNYNWN